jgi:hypothetical protein
MPLPLLPALLLLIRVYFLSLHLKYPGNYAERVFTSADANSSPPAPSFEVPKLTNSI